jgi:hypothetical protein
LQNVVSSATTATTASSMTTNVVPTVNQDETSVYQDLIGFLKSSRVDLRWEATKAVLQVARTNMVSSSEHEIQSLLDHAVIPPLVSLCSDDSIVMVNVNPQDEQQQQQGTNTDPDQEDGAKSIGLNALQSLIQLCGHSKVHVSERCIQELLQAGIVRRLVEVILTTRIPPITTTTPMTMSVQMARRRVYWALALLANVTRTEQGSIELVGTSLPDYAVYRNNQDDETDMDDSSSSSPTLVLLLGRFLNFQYQLVLPNSHHNEKICAPQSLLQYDDDDDEDDDNDNDNDDNNQKGDQNKDENPEVHDDTSDPYQHFATVLMNITQIELGRKFVLKIPQGKSSPPSTQKDSIHPKDAQPLPTVLQRVLWQLRLPPTVSQNNNHNNNKQTTNTSTNKTYDLATIRRRGIAGMIRNCCLDTNAAWWLIHLVHLIPHLLYPLAGPEALTVDEKKGMDVDLWMAGPDKRRDYDSWTRLYLVEAILLLCASGRNNRQSIRLARTYVILKYCDMVETNETISERINECVQYLRRDEQGTAEGSSDELIDEHYQATTTSSPSSLASSGKELLQLPPSTSAMIGNSSSVGGRPGGNTDNGDDYDDVD